MKNLILASAVAVASVFALSVPSEAAPMHHRHYHQHHHHHCHVKKVKRKVHGRWVIRHVRVCR